MVEQARALDLREQTIAAADAYEAAIAAGEADASVYLDLAGLYFESQDFGFQSAQHLPDAFIHRAWTRFPDVLEEGERAVGPYAELRFWRLYRDWLWLGGPEFTDEARRLAQ